MALKGFLEFHSETGTEGGYWAFQDEKFIAPPSAEFPYGRRDYAGLHILKDCDRLRIYDKTHRDVAVWDGIIFLKEYPPFTQYASGMWIHADQEGIDRETWAKYFFDEYPAELEEK